MIMITIIVVIYRSRRHRNVHFHKGRREPGRGLSTSDSGKIIIHEIITIATLLVIFTTTADVGILNVIVVAVIVLVVSGGSQPQG